MAVSAFTKYAEKFMGLSNLAKGAVIGGTAAAIFATKKIFFDVPNAPDLPKVNNLKGFAPNMTREEAMRILNIETGFTPQEVQSKYSKLFGLNHPDKGGSPYVTTKLNQAREILTLGQ